MAVDHTESLKADSEHINSLTLTGLPLLVSSHAFEQSNQKCLD